LARKLNCTLFIIEVNSKLMEASIQEIEEITYIDLEDHMENLVPQFEEIPENNETPLSPTNLG
jgi:hypothetical protein